MSRDDIVTRLLALRPSVAAKDAIAEIEKLRIQLALAQAKIEELEAKCEKDSKE